MTSTPHDVVVVGAGPAGAATALHLAAGGHEVVVVDRSLFPREKICGEGLMPHGVEEVERLGLLDAMRSTGAPWFSGIAYHTGSVRAVGRFPGHEDGFRGLGARRLHIDRVFAEALESHPNIQLQLGTRVRGLTRDADGVSLETTEGTLRGRVVVGADGLNSRVRRSLGLERKTRDEPRYGARLHYRLAAGREVPDVVEVFLGEQLELYVTPVGQGEVNIALLCGKGVTSRFGGDLTAGLEELFRGHPALEVLLDGAERLNEGGLCGPLRKSVHDVVSDRGVLVGDAAGFIDGITGEGMSLTLMSARIAADVLMDALERDALSAADLRPYAVRKARASRELIWLTEMVLWGIRHPSIARWVIRNLARHPETFGRFLAVNAGQRSLFRVGPRDLLRVAVGV